MLTQYEITHMENRMLYSSWEEDQRHWSKGHDWDYDDGNEDDDEEDP